MTGSATGLGWSGCVGGGSAFSNPGMKKSRGETLLEALIPPQPAARSSRARNDADRSNLPFDLTYPSV